MPEQLQWRWVRVPSQVRRNDLVADIPGGQYIVRDATVWEHSRVVEYRDEAVLVIDGRETHLGFFSRGREASDVCEAHYESRKTEVA